MCSLTMLNVYVKLQMECRIEEEAKGKNGIKDKRLPQTTRTPITPFICFITVEQARCQANVQNNGRQIQKTKNF